MTVYKGTETVLMEMYRGNTLFRYLSRSYPLPESMRGRPQRVVGSHVKKDRILHTLSQSEPLLS